jgi:glycosyltransferase involved in cell wall biosynthesis
VCHLNNFNYQLTPSIILEIRRWEKKSGRVCRIVYTAHDLQLVCPNHLCRNPVSGEICEKCLGGHFTNCTRGKCIHGSFAKSVIGTMEATVWNGVGVYRQIDTIICCSHFVKSKLDTNPVLAGKTVALHNFVEPVQQQDTRKKDYVLYFGRYSQEKGIETLLQAAKALPDIPFVFAGSGPLEGILEGVPNIKNVGFHSGTALEKLIREARFSVFPSECYENCPFSVMESQMYGTPVLGADIGGLPELIRPGETGELFKSGSVDQLKMKIERIWKDHHVIDAYVKGCQSQSFMDLKAYCTCLEQYYISK